MAEDSARGMGRGAEGAAVAYLDAAHWRRLLEGPEDAVLASWLALQGAQIPSASRAVLVLRRDGPFRPVAFWPEEGATSRFLMETINEALTQRIDLVRENAESPDTVGIARLVREGTRIIAVVGLEATERSERARQDILRRLQWGSAWIEVLERRRTGRTDEHAIERLTIALEAQAVAGEQEGFRTAAAAALTSLCVHTKAARVSYGIRTRRGARVMAVSNAVRFDRRVSLLRAISEAMDECLDQGETITAPPPDEVPATLVSRKAAALSEARSGGLVVAQPYRRAGRPAGAFVFEWLKDEPPPEHVLGALPDVAALLGPLLHDRRLEERWLVTRVAQSVLRWTTVLLGWGHLPLKVTVLALVAAGLFLSLYRADFRVTADARLRGAVERVVMAPIDGYIVEAPPRAGDTVRAGDLLIKLDDAEFQLEYHAWTARKLQYEAESAQALAAQDRAGLNILRARIEEADAQVRLNQTRIDLTRVAAPFEAVVVSGDLSQSLGQAVERGEELFRIAPLNSYLVEIVVPEQDILFVDEEAAGTLVLTSLPNTDLAFEVVNVTPVTRSMEGANHFLVEANLLNPGRSPIAPGMEGVAKIEAGEARLIWIWSRRIADWARLALWRWGP